MPVNAPKISVIIPVYNTEKYIEKCLLSVVNQTLKDIEIIIINDGSTDNSMVIVQNFANKDKRIKIINQENKLQGAARNKGIEIAEGEYIGFVDSDDWIDLDYFEKLYKAAKKYNSDIALATNVRIGGHKKTKKRLDIKEVKFVSNIQDKFDISKGLKNPCPTNKIYRVNLLKDNNILFPEGVYCEDKLFVAKAIYYANGIVTVPDINYYYFRNPDSTVHKEAKRKQNSLKDAKNTAQRSVIAFLREKIKEDGVNIRDGEFWAVTKEKRIFGIPVFKIKESFQSERFFVFGVRVLTKEIEGNYGK